MEQHKWKMIDPPAEWCCEKCGKMDFEYVPDMEATCHGDILETIRVEIDTWAEQKEAAKAQQ